MQVETTGSNLGHSLLLQLHNQLDLSSNGLAQNGIKFTIPLLTTKPIINAPLALNQLLSIDLNGIAEARSHLGVNKTRFSELYNTAASLVFRDAEIFIPNNTLLPISILTTYPKLSLAARTEQLIESYGTIKLQSITNYSSSSLPPITPNTDSRLTFSSNAVAKERVATQSRTERQASADDYIEENNDKSNKNLNSNSRMSRALKHLIKLVAALKNQSNLA